MLRIHIVSIKKSEQCQLIGAFYAHNLLSSILLTCVNIIDSGFTSSERGHVRSCLSVDAGTPCSASLGKNNNARTVLSLSASDLQESTTILDMFRNKSHDLSLFCLMCLACLLW